MNALEFSIRLLEPLLIANPVSGDENSATSLNYIPGGVIRGALARLFTEGQPGHLTDARFKTLFFGEVAYLNAYPQMDQQRGLPAPLSWYRRKDASLNDPALDLANLKDAPKEPLKRINKPFVHIELPRTRWDEEEGNEDVASAPPTATLGEPARHLSVHILQTDRRNVVRSGTGTVFRYDAVAKGEYFEGVIAAENTADLTELSQLLNGAIFKLGKSRSAGYGLVQAEVRPIKANWTESASLPTSSESRIVVTLLSDAIVRDPKTGAFSATLEPIVGIEASSGFARTHVMGGFNLAWGLPMPQALAIQAGSVFVFPRTDALAQQLQIAQANGIGERCVDGFGRIAVNWHTTDEIVLSEQIGEGAPSDKTLNAGDPGYELAQQMANRIWRTQLDGALRDAIGKSQVEHPPRSTQLARIRVLAGEAWRRKDSTVISRLLKEPDSNNRTAEGMKRTARDQFEKARISSFGETVSLMKWLQKMSDDPPKALSELQASMPSTSRPAIGGVQAEDPPALEYAVRLMDGVLRKAAKEGGN